MNEEMIFACYIFGPIFVFALAVLLVSWFQKSQANRICKILKFLRDDPKTIHEIADHLIIKITEAEDTLNLMINKCYIVSSMQSCWNDEGGIRKPVKIYSLTPIGRKMLTPIKECEPIVKKIRF